MLITILYKILNKTRYLFTSNTQYLCKYRVILIVNNRITYIKNVKEIKISYSNRLLKIILEYKSHLISVSYVKILLPLLKIFIKLK